MGLLIVLGIIALVIVIWKNVGYNNVMDYNAVKRLLDERKSLADKLGIVREVGTPKEIRKEYYNKADYKVKHQALIDEVNMLKAKLVDKEMNG